MNDNSILMPKHKIHMHALKRCDVLHKVKFNITKEVFIVLLPYCVLNLTNKVTLNMNLVLLYMLL